MSTPPPPELPSLPPPTRPTDIVRTIISELRKQRGIAAPLVAMNLTWYAKSAITTLFLGRLGELPLAGGTLGITFANVTGFSVLIGLCGAMDPICGQAYGANNFKLLHKTLIMATLLLLLTTLPITLLWLNVDKILSCFLHQEEMTSMAKRYLLYLLPDLIITSFLCPLKSYLSSQGDTIPIMISSALGLACHVPINIFLSQAKGVEGVSMAVWVSDVIMMTSLLVYVLVMEMKEGGIKWKEGGWWDQGIKEWATLVRLSGACCLTTCLEWWCYEILVLLTCRLPNPKQSVSVVTVVFNYDYLMFAVMLSISVCASTRVSNELGANRPCGAYGSAYVALGTASVAGCVGGVITVGVRGWWGTLFSHDRGVIMGVRKAMVVMAMIEVVNFPVIVSGGIVRGTGRPWLGMYGSIVGFYIMGLPLGVVLGFKAGLGVVGMLLGFLGGGVTCLVMLVVFIMRIKWVDEAAKAQRCALDNLHNIEDMVKDDEVLT